MKNSDLPLLNLPSFDYKITESDGKFTIFDIIRKKNIVLTPEEWVRQHVVHLLIAHYDYPKSLFRVERATSYNSLEKRTDIVVFNREGKPHLLIECKAPEITINQRVIEQASRYNKTIEAPFLCITNGMKTFCFSVNFETEAIVQLKDLPSMA